MSTHQAHSSGGRRSGRGPRRQNNRGGRGDGDGGNSRPDRDGGEYRPNSQGSPSRPSSEPATPAAKPSFLQRILSIFKPKKAAAPAPAPSRDRAERQDRGDRRENTANRGGRGGATVTSSYPTEPRTADRNSQPSQPQSAPAPTRPSRKPEAVEVTTPKLYVGNLSFDATESDLKELFAGVGSVQSAEIVCHKETEKSKGFAFVTMTSIDEGKRAVEVLHDKEFMGRKLVISGAKTPIER